MAPRAFSGPAAFAARAPEGASLRRGKRNHPKGRDKGRRTFQKAPLFPAHGRPPASVPNVFVAKQVQQTMNQEVGHHPVDRDLPAPGQAQRALEAYDDITEQLSGRLRKAPFAHGE